MLHIERQYLDWQEDYDPDDGTTGICPRCGSTEVRYGLAPGGLGRWKCYDCDLCETVLP